MKKLLSVVLTAILVMSLAGCGSNQSTETTTTTAEAAKTTKAVETTEDTTETTTTETEKSATDFAGLADQELVKVFLMNYQEPKSLYTKIVITSPNLPVPMNVILYKDDEGEKSSLDMFGQGQYKHSLYLNEDSYVYSYTDGETEGIKYHQDTSDVADEFLDFSFEDDALDDMDDLAEARIETLDGNECLYTKYVNKDGYTDEMWISLEHKYPIRIIQTNTEQVIEMQMDIVEIETNKNFSSQLQIPIDINFVEQ